MSREEAAGVLRATGLVEGARSGRSDLTQKLCRQDEPKGKKLGWSEETGFFLFLRKVAFLYSLYNTSCVLSCFQEARG